jgi:UDP-glucose 4-epimerase
MKRVLITGANSFIGTNFIKYSENRQTREISLKEKSPEDINFTDVDVVLHVAAIVHQSTKINEKEYFRVNTDLCLRVAGLAKNAGVKHFVFLSTLKVYGKFIPGCELRNESSECFPDDAYGKSKYAAETGLMKMGNESFTVSIIRTPLVYGEGVMANMIKLIKLVDSVPLLPLGKIDNSRNFTYVENLVGFIDRIIKTNASGIFIVMDENPLSTTELVEYISKYLNKRVLLFRVPRIILRISSLLFPDFIDRLYGSLEVSNDKTKKQLGFKPGFSTEKGIEKTVLYYQERKKKAL